MMRRWMQIGVCLAALTATSVASADTIDVNGVKRSYTLQLPAKRLAPLVVVLHGKTQRGADMVVLQSVSLNGACRAGHACVPGVARRKALR